MKWDPASYKDPSGQVFIENGKVFRALSSEGAGHWQQITAEGLFDKLVAAGLVVGTTLARPEEYSIDGVAGTVLKHDRIPVVSYPYEWPFSMLKQAALLHLDIMEIIVQHGFELKDATPYNVQWFGTSAVFIDIPSIVRRPTETSPWIALGQFYDTMLYPLLIASHRGINHNPLLRGSLAGVDAATCSKYFPGLNMFRRGVLLNVKLRAWLESKSTIQGEQTTTKSAGVSAEKLVWIIRRLKKLVDSLTASSTGGVWSDYTKSCTYSGAETDNKAEFVRIALAGCEKPLDLVWDIGANTGFYSELAAQLGSHVVSMDSDHNSIEVMFSRLSNSDADNILPLVFDFSDPSPGLGWKNEERATLEDRGRPDAILALALIHHLRISANLPLQLVVDRFSELTDELIIEFVEREDPMVKQLLVGKTATYDDYNRPEFERLLGSKFEIVTSGRLHETRQIYHARRKS